MDPPIESAPVADAPVAKKRGSRFALVAGYLVTGLLFVGTTGLVWHAAVVGLVGGVVVRTIYVGIRNGKGGTRPLLSPWTLLLASFFAAFALGSSRLSEQEEGDAFVGSLCVEASMQNFDTIAVTDRRFTRLDFKKYSDRYCQEAVDGGLMSGAGVEADQAAFNELSASILAAMLASGEIHEL